MLALLVGLSLVAPPPAARAEISGKPRVMDAGTLMIGGRLVRLWGVEAPDRLQTCRRGAERWRCGMEAENALAFFLAGSWVACRERGADAEGRTLAACSAGGFGGPDLAAWLVGQGWALAAGDGAAAYAEAERRARAAGKGLWQGAFVAPGLWRQGVRLAEEPFSPGEGETCLTGRLTDEGVECPAFRADDGALYTLAGDVGAASPGERLCLCGRRAALSICMQGVTLMVTRVGPPARCPRGLSPRQGLTPGAP